MTDEQVSLALKLFECAPPLTSEDLEKKYRTLQRFWHPHRYANLTNNPRKYMEMFKKAEAKLKEIEVAYEVLRAWVQRQEHHAATE